MRVLFAGTPATAVPSLEAVLKSRHEVVAVLTRPDARSGRGRKLAPSPVAEKAVEAGVEVLKPAKPSEPAFLTRLAEVAPDCAPIVAYGGLIPRAALDVPKYGWVNLHFSLLPAWRGAAPVQHAIMRGDDVTGASTFQLEEGLDTGPVFGLVTEEIRATDTSGALLDRLATSGAELLVRTLDGIADGTLRPERQPADGGSMAPKLTVADAAVDWIAPALHIDRLIRACTPAPGAWTMFRGERFKLAPVEPETERTDLAPGELLVEKSGVYAGTGSHAVRFGDVQPQGKRMMPAADWVRGVRPEPGEELGQPAA